MRGCATIFALIALAASTGCSSTKLANGGTVYSPDPTKVVPQVDTTNLLPANIPYAGTVIPNSTFRLTPNISVTLEKVVLWGGAAAAAYVVLDPLAPNWSVEEAQFPNDHFHLSLHMKRYYSGGAGEARMIFHRRAKELAKALGYDGYQVVEYSESLDSSVIGSQRNAEGVIQLTKKYG